MIFNNLYFYLIIVILAPSLGKLFRNSYELYKKFKEYNLGINPISSLRRLTGREFEIWSCDYLASLGYNNIALSSPKLDNAKNIICSKDSIIYYVECRKYSSSQFITNIDIEALLGSLIINNMHNGIIITTSKLSDAAQQTLSSLPENYNITVYDYNKLLKISSKLVLSNN